MIVLTCVTGSEINMLEFRIVRVIWLTIEIIAHFIRFDLSRGAVGWVCDG
jgi:hypothetical protein